MKKISTLLIAMGMLPLAMAAESKTVPYASGLYQDSDWTVENVNKDDKTWEDESSSYTFSGTGYTVGIKYSYNRYSAADDWYISPAITLEAGKEYKLKIWSKTSSSSTAENWSVKLANNSSVSSLSDGVALITKEGYNATNWNNNVEIFQVEETGNYYFGIYCFSPKDKYTLYLTGFEVCENIFAPAAVSDLTCTPGENRKLEATLAWKLPTTDNDGATLPADASFDEIIIKRDGNVVANLFNAETEWIDTEATGLTPGYHTYEVGVVVNGAPSAFSKVDSKYIGPIEAMTLPYDADIKNLTQEDFDLFWTPVKGRNSKSTNDWKLSVSTYYGNSIQYTGGSGKQQDDWVISPSMKFNEPGVYKLSVNLSYTNYNHTDFDILLGTGNSIGGYETVIRNFKDIPSAETDYEIFFTIDRPGEYGIAFHAKDETGSYYTYYIKNFKVEKWQMTPAHVSDLSTAVNPDATVTLNWTNPTTSNTGTDLTDLTKVELYCNGELAETFSDVQPGATMSYVHTPATNGVHEYYVLPYSSEGPADGEPVKVKTAWVGDETQSLPYSTKFLATDATTPIWSSVNSEWEIPTSSPYGPVIKPGNSTVKNNDYLLSPYFELAEGYYSVTYSISGAGSNYTVGVGITSDKSDVPSTYKQCATIKLPGRSYALPYTNVIKIDEAGKYAFVLYANDVMGASDYKLTVTEFSVAYQPVLPGIATDVTVTPAADLSHAATISWTNPSTSNVDGVMPELVKAEIARDGEVIGEVTEGLVPGEVSTFEDTTVPNAGEYTYTVTIYGLEGASSTKPTEVKSPWIGAGMNLPFDCEDGFREAGWNIYNVNNDKNTWGDPITWEAYSGYLNITSNNNTPNDWAITPRLNFTAGSKYILSITSYYSNGYEPVDWDVHFGTSVTPESMTTKLATIHTTNPSASRQTDLIYLEVIAADEVNLLSDDAEEEEPETPTNDYILVPAGVGTIGLHANQKGAFNVSGFSIKPENPASIENIKLTEGGIAVIGSEIFFGSEAEAVAVYNLAGKTVMTANGVSHISLSSLSKGVYVVKATVNDEILTTKVVK